jgi:hydrogenase-4 component E
MTGAVGWLLIALALAVIVVRRRSTAIVVVATQSLVIALVALAEASHRSGEFMSSALALLAKAIFIAAVLGWSVRRTRQDHPITEALAAPVRLAVAAAIAITAAALVPRFGLPSLSEEHATVALVVIGITAVIVRKATLFQVLGLLVAENGIAFAATAVAGGMPMVIDLGVIFDVVIVLSVATAFHERIFREFGSGDATVLRGLRD